MFKKTLPSLLLLVVLQAGAGICAAQEVPSPESVLGFKVGADFHLATYEKAVAYLRALEKTSPKIRLFEMGKTGMGRSWIYAVITSEQNMSQLERYKQISRRLAEVKSLNDEEAQRLAAEGKAIVYIEGGVHASECAPPQSQMQLAYDLLTAQDAGTRSILENVIFLLVFANPDGMTLLSEWYQPNVGTPYETSPPPWLENRYAGGNINRDAFAGNINETRNIVRLVNREWYPVVLYSHHQTAPFPARIWIPPAAEPTNPNLHPLFLRGKNLIASAMGYAFDRKGQPGAISRLVFDFWYPGYLDSYCDFFHVISIMTETALYRHATPHFYTPDEFPEEYRDFTPSVFYPSPWKGGWWRLRDAVEYCLTGSKSVLAAAADFRERLLYGRYMMGRDTAARFEKEAPYAWIVPQDQWDPPVAARMLNWLAEMGINIYRAEQSFNSDGTQYPAGTWVIPMNQPFALFVKAVFEKQSYPDLTKYPALWQGIVGPQKFPGAYLPPYDMAGWTLPSQMGVKVAAAGSPVEASLAPLKQVLAPAGSVPAGTAASYLISPKTNNSFIAVNRLLGKSLEVSRAREPFAAAAVSYPAGTFVIPAVPAAKGLMDSLAQDLYLDVDAAPIQVAAKTYKLKAPRIALYRPWISNSDEGWTRLLLEQYEFPFTNIHDAEVRAGGLGAKFDVVVIPSMTTEALVSGNKPETMPRQYAGGITNEGARNLREFVEGGGTLVTLNAACAFALDVLGIPVKDALKGLQAASHQYGAAMEAQAAGFACPGSVLNMEFNGAHPVAFGMPEKGAGMFYGSTAFDIVPSFQGNTPLLIARYPSGNVLSSGYLAGEKYLQNKAAALDAPLGNGRIILLGFAVQNRAQPHGTFKLLFNSLYYGSAGK